MAYRATIATVRKSVQETSAEVDRWFDRPSQLLGFRPPGGGWSIEQILEHISLTSHFLLLTVERHSRIALHRFRRGDRIPEGESDLEGMAAIGRSGSFR